MHLTRITFVLLSCLLGVTPAFGQSCNFTISDVTFGPADVIAGGNVDVTATLNVSCGLGVAVRICPSIGAGTGGADATARQMAGPGGALLNYQLYSDAGRTVVWGSYGWGLPGTPPTIDLVLGGNTSRTIFARVFSGQNTVPVGAYLSSFTAIHTNFIYANLGITACPNLLFPQTSNPTFTVTADVESNCLVNAQNIDFGPHGVLSADVDATGQISVTCTADADYSIGLDGGLAGGTPTTRKMSKAAEQITYGLYRDAGRSQAWGETIGVNTMAGTGTGVVQNYTVYARVPPQTTPTPGLYQDTIVVTVTY
jgi:spore coat protein U-like protein